MTWVYTLGGAFSLFCYHVWVAFKKTNGFVQRLFDQ